MEWGPGGATRRLALLDSMMAAADTGGEPGIACEGAQLRFAALVERADPLAAATLTDLETRADRLGSLRP